MGAFKLAGINFEKDFVCENDLPDNAEASLASPWVSREEAAAYARCSTDTIDNWLDTGKVFYAKLNQGRPGRVLIERNSLDKYIRDNKARKRYGKKINKNEK